MGPFFGTAESVGEYLAPEHVLPKFEEKLPEKWNEWFKTQLGDGKSIHFKALGSKEEATLINSHHINVEQLRDKAGGQLIEVTSHIGDKNFASILCELPNENWALVYYAEKTA